MLSIPVTLAVAYIAIGMTSGEDLTTKVCASVETLERSDLGEEHSNMETATLAELCTKLARFGRFPRAHVHLPGCHLGSTFSRFLPITPGVLLRRGRTLFLRPPLAASSLS